MFVHWLDGWLVGWFVGHSVNVHFCAPIGALVTEWTTRNHVVRISSSGNFTINVHEKISVAWKGQACVTGLRMDQYGRSEAARGRLYYPLVKGQTKEKLIFDG